MSKLFPSRSLAGLSESKKVRDLVELVIADLAKLKPGRIFYSGRLYVVEASGSASKARPWGTPPGTKQGSVTFSSRSTLARFYPVLERALVLPIFKRADFLLDKQPTAYAFATELDARRVAQLDSNLAINSGLGLQRRHPMAAWLLTDGVNPYRVYHYAKSADDKYAEYCARHGVVERAWPDELTPHWKLLFDPDAPAFDEK